MCYTVTSLNERSLKYAIHYAQTEEQSKKLVGQLGKLREWRRTVPEYNHVSGFDHPDLICITADEITHKQWGLVPFWVKDELKAVKLRNSTLNARGETIFEKPSFREPARDRRCVVLVQGFFEYHHANKKTYPFHIKLRSSETMLLAGLWDYNEVMGRSTVTIVTTEANGLLAEIHNNPKLSGPRMPVILTKEESRLWINDLEAAKELIRPYTTDDMEAYTVAPLKGKEAEKNYHLSRNKYVYADLDI